MEDSFRASPSDVSSPPAHREVKIPRNVTRKLADLREEISKLIAPWRDSTEEPPFTGGEMTVFALILSDQECLSSEDIHVSILRTFRYYNDLAITRFAHAMRLQFDHNDSSIDIVIEGFPDCLSDFDIPITMKLPEDYHDDRQIGIDTAAASVYLEALLKPTRKGTFRFLDLSAELRNRIYEMVLGFPDPGLNVACEYLGYRPQLNIIRAKREPGDSGDPFCATGSEGVVYIQPLDELLALFQTCKQIYAEASSVFYGSNTFRFGSLSRMHDALMTMSSGTKKQLRYLHIALDPSYRELRYMQQVGNLLHQLAPKHLKITLDHERPFKAYNDRFYFYREEDKPSPVHTFAEVDDLKPFINLARRAESVEVVEVNGTGFEDFVRGQLRETLSPEEAGASEDRPIVLEE